MKFSRGYAYGYATTALKKGRWLLHILCRRHRLFFRGFDIYILL